MNEIAPHTRRDVTLREAQQHVKQSQSIPAIRTTHLCHRIIERGFRRDLIRGGHYGQRSVNRT